MWAVGLCKIRALWEQKKEEEENESFEIPFAMHVAQLTLVLFFSFVVSRVQGLSFFFFFFLFRFSFFLKNQNHNGSEFHVMHAVHGGHN